MAISPGESKESDVEVETETVTIPATPILSEKENPSGSSNGASNNNKKNIVEVESGTETIPAVSVSKKSSNPAPTIKEVIAAADKEKESAVVNASPNPSTVTTESNTETTNKTKVKDKDLVAAPEFGPGWTVLTKYRKVSGDPYRYYLSPIKKYHLKSRPAVGRFLAALKTMDGDETQAYAKASNRGTKTKSNIVDDNSNNTVASPKSGVGKKLNGEVVAAKTKAKNKNKNKNEKIIKGEVTVAVAKKPKPKTQATKSPKAKVKANSNNGDDDDPPPKRPSSTFIMYTRNLRQKVMEENPNAKPVEISRILGGIWKAITEPEKDKIQKQYDHELEIYRGKMKDWKLRNPGKDAAFFRNKKRAAAAALEEKKHKHKKASLSSTKSNSKPNSKSNTKSSSSSSSNANSSSTDSSTPRTAKARKAKTAEGSEWWEVEGFRDRRVNRYTGKEEYLIKWRGCPESSNTWEPSANLSVQDDAKEWWKQETNRRNNLLAKRKRMDESMKRLGIKPGPDGKLSMTEAPEDESEGEGEGVPNTLPDSTNTVCKRKEAPPSATHTTRAKAPLVEDKTWNWDDTSQVNFRTVRRVSVHEPNVRETVTEARINGTPLVLIGHVGWANFALRWLRRNDGTDNENENKNLALPAPDTDSAGAVSTPTKKGDTRETKQEGNMTNGVDTNVGDVVPMEVSKVESTASGVGNSVDAKGSVVPMEEASKEENVASGDANCTKNGNNNDLGSTSPAAKGNCDGTEALEGDVKENNENTKPRKNSSSESSAPSATATSTGNSATSENIVKEEAKPGNINKGQIDPNKTKKPKIVVGGKEEENPKDNQITTNGDATLGVEGIQKPLDLSDPSWYLDIKAMSDDIGDEEVPVVKKNYNESKPISGNILASKFFEAGWKATKEDSPMSSSSRKRQNAVLYLHQWQFPLSVEAGKKLCHQSVPLPNHILGEDLLKYWLDRVKLDSPLQYLFMGNADTMSKIHRDNGGLAISIAPITGEKECVLVHRDDGHACLYHNQAPLDPEDIDLNAYPLLPHARIWRTIIKPGEILLMPHGTYHQCRNVTPCLSYSRFHLDGVNLRAFLHSMIDGDAPELHQDEVLWNATRELIDVVDKASDEKRSVDEIVVKAVDALRALRNIAKEVTRKLQVRQTVKGMDPSSLSVSSSVNIDGDAEIWQSLVDDVDMSLHEFRYRFNKKIPSFKRRRSIGRKILALPALPFRGKSKPSKKELTQGRNEPVVAFECPTDRGFLALPKAPSDISPEDKKKVDDAIGSIVVGDNLMVRIEGRKCPARVTEVTANARMAWISFEDLPSVYNDFVPCDLLRTPSVGGSCLPEPLPEDIKPGKMFVCLMGKDEYRGVVQHIKCGWFFKSKLDFGNGFTIDKLIDPESILSVTKNAKRPAEKENKGKEEPRRKIRKIRAVPMATPIELPKEKVVTTSVNTSSSNSNSNPDTEMNQAKEEEGSKEERLKEEVL